MALPSFPIDDTCCNAQKLQLPDAQQRHTPKTYRSRKVKRQAVDWEPKTLREEALAILHA